MDRRYFWGGALVVVVAIIVIVILTKPAKKDTRAKWVGIHPPVNDGEEVTEPAESHEGETAGETSAPSFPVPENYLYREPGKAFVHEGKMYRYTDAISSVIAAKTGQFAETEGLRPSILGGQTIDRMDHDFCVAGGKLYRISNLDNPYDIRMRLVKTGKKIRDFSRSNDRLYLRTESDTMVYTIREGAPYYMHTVEPMGAFAFGPNHWTIEEDAAVSVYNYDNKLIQHFHKHASPVFAEDGALWMVSSGRSYEHKLYDGHYIRTKRASEPFDHSFDGQRFYQQGEIIPFRDVFIRLKDDTVLV